MFPNSVSDVWKMNVDPGPKVKKLTGVLQSRDNANSVNNLILLGSRGTAEAGQTPVSKCRAERIF